MYVYVYMYIYIHLFIIIAYIYRRMLTDLCSVPRALDHPGSSFACGCPRLHAPNLT